MTLGFRANYIYGHLPSIGDLKPLKTLFVDPSRNSGDEASPFIPRGFEGRSVEQIKADLVPLVSKIVPLRFQCVL